METLTQTSLRDQLLHVIDNKTKPIGALGRLEEIALQVGLIQSTLLPRLDHPHIVVFAGDHGIATTGLVNPYPQSVTAQMVLNFLKGGAAINVFCRQHELGLMVVDSGVNFDFGPGLYPGNLLSRKIAYGTKNYLEGAAMSAAEAVEALEAGAEIVSSLHENGCNCIGFGEMGIGNSSSAALIMSYVTGIPVEECAGRGTGVSDEQLDRKKEVLRTVFRRHLPVIAAHPGAMTILQQVGGFEIAMMTGAYLRAAELKMIILVDGFISTSALLLARLIREDILDYCFFSHVSGESGHAKMLDYLDAEPLLDLGMRLGEGTGVAMAWPLIRAAVQFLREMASFESAGVSKAG
jgi:nicotinate-nucleotide--dimethylbenzimidazole phosphoribosyltransferase